MSSSLLMGVAALITTIDSCIHPRMDARAALQKRAKIETVVMGMALLIIAIISAVLMQKASPHIQKYILSFRVVGINLVVALSIWLFSYLMQTTRI